MAAKIKYMYNGEVVRTSHRTYTHAWTYNGRVMGCSSSAANALKLARSQAPWHGAAVIGTKEVRRGRYVTNEYVYDIDGFMEHVQIVELEAVV